MFLAVFINQFNCKYYINIMKKKLYNISIYYSIYYTYNINLYLGTISYIYLYK